MTSRAGLVPWMIACMLLAAGVSYLVSRTVSHSHSPSSGAGSEADFHLWMHENLNITPDQKRELEPYETRFETDRLRLRGEIREAGHALAEAIREGKADSPEVVAALARLNKAQAELQRITLDHFFAMKEHLSSDQADRLLEWTHDSILHNHRH